MFIPYLKYRQKITKQDISDYSIELINVHEKIYEISLLPSTEINETQSEFRFQHWFQNFTIFYVFIKTWVGHWNKN